jgi:hypothetical protein
LGSALDEPHAARLKAPCPRRGGQLGSALDAGSAALLKAPPSPPPEGVYLGGALGE